MKKLGVEWILSVSAVGSMKEEIHPGDIVIVDQFIDRTKRARRRSSATASPGTSASPIRSAPTWRAHVYAARPRRPARACTRAAPTSCIEGPLFSTRAESNVYRSWGVDVIGMTNLPEAKLAREAEICYATLALSTDYDCWHETEEDVTRRGGGGDHPEERGAGQAASSKARPTRIPEARGCGCQRAARTR